MSASSCEKQIGQQSHFMRRGRSCLAGMLSWFRTRVGLVYKKLCLFLENSFLEKLYSVWPNLYGSNFQQFEVFAKFFETIAISFLVLINKKLYSWLKPHPYSTATWFSLIKFCSLMEYLIICQSGIFLYLHHIIHLIILLISTAESRSGLYLILPTCIAPPTPKTQKKSFDFPPFWSQAKENHNPCLKFKISIHV